VLTVWGEDVDGVCEVEEMSVKNEEAEKEAEDVKSQSPELTATPAVKRGRWGELGVSLWG
jgi:hypothetical protein